MTKYILYKAGVSEVSGDKHLGYLVKTLNQQVEAFRELGSGFGQMISDSLIRTRASDTVFIMGSGPSINSLSSEQFEEIAMDDSIGFNFWLAHDMVPTHYVLQLPPEGVYRDSFIGLLERKQKSYHHCEILVRGDHTFRGVDAFRDLATHTFQDQKLWFLPELAIHSRVQIDPRELIEFFSFLGFLEHGRIAQAVPKWRGTLGLILSLAFQMGYKNIILCGIDMNDPFHFYDNPVYKNRWSDISLPEPNSHLLDFESVGYSRNTVSRYITDFARFAYERAGTQLFLASPGSRLEGIIPDWEFGRKGS